MKLPSKLPTLKARPVSGRAFDVRGVNPVIERLETPRLVLRKARPDDLEAIWRNVWSDDAIARNMLWRPTHSREAAVDRLARTMKIHAEHPVFFVCLKDTDEPVGLAGVRGEGRGVYEECGICVASRYQGQGLGREILEALIRLVFEALHGVKFIYGCFRENAVSARLCRSMGFRCAYSREGVRDWDGYRYVSDHYVLDQAAWAAKERREGR